MTGTSGVTEPGTPVTRRAVGYVRASTLEQAHNGYGLQVQEEAIRAYCREHGLRLVSVARDEGESGSNGLDTRRGLAGALATLEGHQAGALVVYRLDRLARDLILQETLLGRLRAAGAEVLSVTEPDVDSDDATRVLVRQVLGAISQYERALIRARLTAGKEAKRAAGGYVGGGHRYGTRPEGKELVPADDEAEAVELIVSLRAGGASYRVICAELAAAGLVPRKGGSWQPAVVRRVTLRADVA